MKLVISCENYESLFTPQDIFTGIVRSEVRIARYKLKIEK